MKSGQLVWSQFCVARAVCAGFLEDVSTGQQSSAVVDKTGKETANVVCRIHFSTLVNKVESSVTTKTHASGDHHMLHKLLTLSYQAWRQLSCRPPKLCCSGCWQEDLDIKKILVGEENTFRVTNFESTKQNFEWVSCTGCRTKFLSALKSLGTNTVMLINL